MEYIQLFITVATIHLLAVMSPGPDFLMVSRNSLVYSRGVGINSAIGLGLGILVHVVYSLIGIAWLISQSVLLFSIIKYIGAAYLIYIGYKSLRSRKMQVSRNATDNKNEISKFAAIRMGFLTNVLNPKATLFFLALFTQVIDPTTPLVVQALMGLEMAVVTFLWFAVVAVLLSHKRVQSKFAVMQHRVEQVFGVLLIALGVKVAVSS